MSDRRGCQRNSRLTDDFRRSCDAPAHYNGCVYHARNIARALALTTIIIMARNTVNMFIILAPSDTWKSTNLQVWYKNVHISNGIVLKVSTNHIAQFPNQRQVDCLLFSNTTSDWYFEHFEHLIDPKTSLVRQTKIHFNKSWDQFLESCNGYNQQFVVIKFKH